MKKRFSIAYFITLLFALLAAGFRLWSLLAAVDEQGLPVTHLSTTLLIAASALFLLLALFLSFHSPGRSGRYQVLTYGTGGFLCSMTASIFILVGSCVRIWRSSALRSQFYCSDHMSVRLVGRHLLWFDRMASSFIRSPFPCCSSLCRLFIC